MISFPCPTCGERLSVPADQAGLDVQCARCGVLSSVPLASDLAAMNADGTLRLSNPRQATAPPDDPDRVEELVRLFGSKRIDAGGKEIDNRTLPEVIELAPVLEPKKRPAPQYDPETGELVTPLTVAKPLPLPALPLESDADVPRPEAIPYATPGQTEFPGAAGIWMKLFEPTNMIVLVVVTVAHVVGSIIQFFVLFLLAYINIAGETNIPAWPFNFLFWLVAAHYANVVESTGPGERDELPAVLRGLSFIDDIVAPLFRILVAFLVAYLPFLLLIGTGNVALRMLSLPFLVAGGLVFPALLLTLAAGQTFANVRPDRIARVIRSCGKAYWPLATLSVFLVPVYLFTLGGIDLISPIFEGTPVAHWLDRGMVQSLITMPLALAAIYAMHGLCWRLGQLFRRYGMHFGWLWEEVEARIEADRKARFEARQRAARERRQTSISPPRRSSAFESLPPRDHI